MTAAGQVIQINKIGTFAIPLSGGKTIKLHNIAYAPECNTNLISLGQVCKSGILFYANDVDEKKEAHCISKTKAKSICP